MCSLGAWHSPTVGHPLWNSEESDIMEIYSQEPVLLCSSEWDISSLTPARSYSSMFSAIIKYNLIYR